MARFLNIIRVTSLVCILITLARLISNFHNYSSDFGSIEDEAWSPTRRDPSGLLLPYMITDKNTSAEDILERGEGCRRWKGVMSSLEVKNNLLQKSPPRGIVVTLLLGENVIPYLKRFIPSQLEHFVYPHGLDMLIVLRRHSKPSMHDIKISLNLTSAGANSVREWRNLDNSTMRTFEFIYYYGNSNSSNTINKRDNGQGHTRIYLTETDIRLPEYVKANRSILDIPITPSYCQEPLDYIQGTRWYIYEMLHLSILKEYEYFIKLDADIVFIRTISFNVLHDMKIRGAVFGHTAQYPNHMVGVCADEITRAIHEFQYEAIENEPPLIRMQPSKWSWNGTVCSSSHPRMNMDSDLYYTNFIIGSTDYFQAPEVLALGRYLSEYPNGFFKHRWTDQAFWHFALGLFIGPAFEDAVADYTDFRCSPEINCWMSSHDPERIENSFDQCNNGGYFLHTKNHNKWSEMGTSQTIPSQMVPGAKPINISEKTANFPLKRLVVPYKNLYTHDCRNSKWRYKALNV